MSLSLLFWLIGLYKVDWELVFLCLVCFVSLAGSVYFGFRLLYVDYGVVTNLDLLVSPPVSYVNDFVYYFVCVIPFFGCVFRLFFRYHI